MITAQTGIEVLPIATQVIDPGALAAINDAWMHNAMQLGIICLIVGFAIGLFAGYMNAKRKYGSVQ